MVVTADGLRYFGIACELVGLLLVASDISARRKETKAPSVVDWIKKHRPFRRPQDHRLEGEANIKTAVGKNLGLIWNVKAGSELTTEQRLKALEEKAAEARRQLDDLGVMLTEEIRLRNAAEEAHQRAQQATDAKIDVLTRRLLAGGLWRERAGVGLFLLGLVLTNLSEEMARWI